MKMDRLRRAGRKWTVFSPYCWKQRGRGREMWDGCFRSCFSLSFASGLSYAVSIVMVGWPVVLLALTLLLTKQLVVVGG